MRAIRWALLAVLLAAAGCAAARPQDGGGPAAIAPVASAPAPPPRPLRPARINHVVFFKLKDPAEAPQLIHDCDELLTTIPGIAAGWSGTRLDTGSPGDPEDEYDVSFYAGFMTQADYDTYLEHAAHAAAAEKWGPHLKWLRVHDVLDDTP